MKLLVANRGEIASRVFDTARRLGWRTVAVFAEPDRDAPFVQHADESCCIGPAALDRSYLSVAGILGAAAQTGADAVHPGYGFLSENAEFARAVIDAGLIWVGPHPEAIAQMGAKIEARRIAEAAGVPTIPGASEADLAAVADEIGYPVLVKASAGGGGKGIRIVRSASEIADALASARTEALRSFGDDRVIVERYIERPRHVEVQVAGDRHGTVVHLGTRDCSSQRRYQKLLEEAPAPNLPDATREGLHESALALACHIGYDSAGTVEFIVDGDSGEFFFLEMNTRLQVEHPVTEAVCGVDLVELQLRAATGQPLGLRQTDVTFAGHSVEARINAEDPADGFSPQAGPVRHLRVPAGVRWDAAVQPGSEITPYYDPLIAKLTVTRSERGAALDALRDALDELVLGPVPTNAGFLRWLADAPQLRNGDMTTGVIDALDASEFPAAPSPSDTAPTAAAAWLSGLRRGRRAADTGPWAALGGFRLTEHRSCVAVVLRDAVGGLHEVGADALLAVTSASSAPPASPTPLASSAPSAAPALPASPTTPASSAPSASPTPLASSAPSASPTTPAEPAPDSAPSLRRPSAQTHGRFAGASAAAAVSATQTSVAVNVAGHTVTFDIPDRSDAWAPHDAAETGSAGDVTAPFPAVVVEVVVAIGDTVGAGDTVVTAEAMKMLHSLTAAGAGTVAEVRCTPGDAVEAGQVLITFERT